MIYPGQFTSLYAVDNLTPSYVWGTGGMTYDVDPTSMIEISATKMDDSSQRLTVQILKDGNVIKSEFTDAPHGSVAASVKLVRSIF